MRTIKEYKNEALAALKGKWPEAVVATLILAGAVWVFMVPYLIADLAVTGMIGISGGMILYLSCFSLAGMIFLLPHLDIGYANAFLQFTAYDKDNIVGSLAENAFRGYWRNLWCVLLTRIFVFLWSLLLIVPGIIKTYSYALTPYLIKEFPDLGVNACLNLSKKMMKGHKLDLFCLQLSFIGWYLLCILSLGIGLLWLLPYVGAAYAGFYQDVKSEYEGRE